MNEPKSLRAEWQAGGDAFDEAQMQAAAQRAISISDMHLAIDIAKTAIERFGRNPVTQYYLALAYANCGSRQEVFTLMTQLMESVKETDAIYVDALCLVGRLEKDKYLRDGDHTSADVSLVSALEAYHDAYEVSGGSFPGINAATLFLLANAQDKSRAIAAKIITENASDQDEFWQLATLAEAHLLLEEYDSARHYYLQVVEQAGTNFGLLASVKKHLPLIATKLKVPGDILKILSGPAIAVFTGHMYDTGERESPRFPQSLRAGVSAEIGAMIDANQIKIGYSSAACGADLIFCQEMLNRGLELNIVLPFADEEFRRTSVALSGVDETALYWDVLKSANSVSIATDESHLNNPCLYTHAADLIEGYARLRAIQCDGDVQYIAAIDPYTRGEVGGSAERAVIWLEEGKDVQIADIGKLRGEDKTSSLLPASDRKKDTRQLDREIKSIVEVSSNTHDDVVHRVMAGKIPEADNALQGEGINRAFDNVKDAAEYAYHIRALAQLVPWEEMDLPSDTQLQIAIHTGPIFPRSKSKDKDYFGTHVFYARDLAEVTPPGCVYLTEPAAALLETHGPADFVADYLGIMEVKSKRRQIYRLHRA